MPAELVRLAADLGVPGAATDPVACFEDDDVVSRADEQSAAVSPAIPAPTTATSVSIVVTARSSHNS